jgi:hypothetical protein
VTRPASRLILSLFLASLVGVLCASSASAHFGFQSGAAGFDGSFTNGDGTTDTQAGSHPYEFTSTIDLNTAFSSKGKTVPDGAAKDIAVNLSPGVVGNASATPKCTPEQLAHSENPQSPAEACPFSSQIGTTVVDLAGNQGPVQHLHESLFNMVAPKGTAAVFGFYVIGVLVYIDAHVRTGSDYGITSSSLDVPQGFPLVGTTLTLWGVPGDPSHDDQRCPALVVSETGFCSEVGYWPAEPHESDVPRKPFLTLPTSCLGPQTTTISADSWQEPGAFVEDSYVTHDESGEQVGFEGCNRLGFTPTLSVRPDTSAADTPTGLHVDLHLPQNEDPEGLSEADLKNVTVTLPAGVSVNPSSADGLAACSPAQIELSGPEPATCPEASKIGSVEVTTPLLENPLRGGVYLAEQDNNPFGSLLAIYISVVDPQSGVVVKLAGHVEPDPQTGQLRTTFANNPQQPFEDLKLDFFDGPRAPLVTPSACGTFTTTSDMTPWSSPDTLDASPSDSFAITSGANGAACASGFAPSFTSGTLNPQAGAFSPFSTTIARGDQEQDLSGVSVTTAPGLLGVLKGVERCGEPQASQGACGAGSLIGHASSWVGAGPDPYDVQGGQVFLTGPYKGAPFGLSIVVPAVAGPFNLGDVVVRAAVSVDPHTAQITVKSDPLPVILQGIPLLIRKLNVTIDRAGFMFNPTNCESSAIDSGLLSTAGASAPVASHFQAANCAALPFKPQFSASTRHDGELKDHGASLKVHLAFPSAGPQSAAALGEANAKSITVTLPKALPARLSTLQKACTAAQFESNPAGCPEASFVGEAVAHTPILASPLTGPAILVSHGGEAFPDMDLVLQGEGITIDLIGNTDIKKGVTTSRFASIPDAPVSSFELTLPEGPHSVLAANESLCRTKLTMPTAFVAQNGATLNQNTVIEPEGCSDALGLVSKKLSAKTLTLRVSVPGAGQLSASGKGLTQSAKSSSGRETVAIELRVRQKGKFATKVTLRFSSSSGEARSKSRTRLSKSIEVKA